MKMQACKENYAKFHSLKISATLLHTKKLLESDYI